MIEDQHDYYFQQKRGKRTLQKPIFYHYECTKSYLFLFFVCPIVYSHSTRLLAATTLRNVLGTKNLAEILSERETIAHVMQSSLDEATDPWGVKVERVEM